MSPPAPGNDLARERFGRFAAGYVTSATHAKGGELARLVELASPQRHWNVLDVATGGGHTALAFAPHVRHVVATDLTPAMLAQAEAHIRGTGTTNVSFEIADAESLPFAPATFDLVTCRIAPHHFPNPGRFVREAERMVKPDGFVLVQDQVVPDDPEAAALVNGFERMRDPSHLRALTLEEWLNLFQVAGLAVLHCEVVVKRHEFLGWTQMQDNAAAQVAALVSLVDGAPMAAREWLDPTEWGTAEATFVNRHGILLGRRPPWAGSGESGMSVSEPVAKAVVYVTAGEKLLVFRHPGSPEAGLQVPAGTIEPGEAPEAAALREASEETGLDLLGPARSLGVRDVDMAPFGGSGWVRRHFYQAEAPVVVPDRWRHTEETPSTGGAAVPLEVFWVDADCVPPLAADQGAMLDSLRRRGGV